MSMKANGKAIDYSGSGNAAADKGSNRSHPASHVISANRFNLMMFRDITYGPQEAELRFRLLHFWEARVPVKNTLLGLELLLIDEQGTVIKGFITPGRINKFRPRLRKGALYSLVNFYGSRSNGEFRVAAHNVTVSFAHHSELSVIEDSPSMIGKPTIEVSEVATSRRMVVHIQPHELVSHPDVVNQVNAEVVTKRETATIGEIFAYMKQESAKPAFCECTATIDDVVHDAAWYYIGCGGCKTKATRGATSLMCGKCGKNDITGEAQYLAKLSVYDKSEEAVFVLLGDAGTELTGKPAAELVRNYFETRKLELMCLFQKLYLAQLGRHTISVSKFHNTISRKKQIATDYQDSAFTCSTDRGTIASADGDGVILEGSRVTATMGAKELGDGTEFGNSKRVKRGD
ncbi:hypothetical protein Bca101_053748 [Brassica carinata]